MHKPIQISIPNPCSEDWSKMTPQEQGRFCNHCQKCVVDFTGWTDAQVYNYIAQHKNQNICGRFQTTQLNRTINIPPQPHSLLYKYFIGLGLTLVFTQLPNNVKAQTPYSYNNSINKLTPAHGGIKGQITDIKNNSLLDNAYIELRQGGNFIAHALSNPTGEYTISDITPGRYDLTISNIGYKTVLIKEVIVSPDRFTAVNNKLEADSINTKEAIGTYYKVPLTGNEHGGRPTISKEDIDKMPVRMTNAVIATSNISGIILDEKKEPILGAIIELQQNGLTKFGDATNEDGIYYFNSVPYGNYTIKAMYSSYLTDSSKIEINSNTITKDIQLRLNPNDTGKVYVTLGMVAMPNDSSYYIEGKGHPNFFKRTWYWLTRWTR
jgi:hypothetical protein